ncbi:hypothetical protein YB2330_006361 [Saitoella coloradoensis]
MPTICAAHTGATLGTRTFASLDAAKGWITSMTGIEARFLILMTNGGTQVKEAELRVEGGVVYVFNRAWLTRGMDASVSSLELEEERAEPPMPPPPTRGLPMDEILQKRAGWAMALAGRSRELQSAIRRKVGEIGVLHDAVDVAMTNLESHSASVREAFGEIEGVVEQEVRRWEELLEGVAVLEKIVLPAKLGERTLRDVLDPEGRSAEAVAAFASNAKTLKNDIKEIKDIVQQIATGSSSLSSTVQTWRTATSLQEFLTASTHASEQASLIATRIRTDCSSLSSSSRPAYDIQRISQQHIQNDEPRLMHALNALVEIHGELAEVRARDVRKALGCLGVLSGVQSLVAGVGGRMKGLGIEAGEEGAVVEGLVRGIEVYAYVLRGQRMEMAELLSGYESVWKGVIEVVEREPGVVGKKDVQDFLRAIKFVRVLQRVYEETVSAVALPRATQAPAFTSSTRTTKSTAPATVQSQGAQFPEAEVLRHDKARVEEKLKHAESRIRNLEDILHRQMRTSKDVFHSASITPTATPSPGFEGPGFGHKRSVSMQGRPALHSAPPTTVMVGSTSPSTSSNPAIPTSMRRTPSSQEGSRELCLLKAELTAQKEQILRLQAEKSIAAKNLDAHQAVVESMKTLRQQLRAKEEEVREVVAVKGDLMANLEGMRGEYVREKTDLEGQIDELRRKLERVEEEADEEHERRVGAEERVLEMEEELGEVERRWQGVVDELREVRKVNRGLEEEVGRVRGVWESEVGSARETLGVLREQCAAEQAAKKGLEETAKRMKVEHEEAVRKLEERVAHNEQSSRAEEELTSLLHEISRIFDTPTFLQPSDLVQRISLLIEENQLLRVEKDQIEGRLEQRSLKARDLTQRLYTYSARCRELLEMVENMANKSSRSGNASSGAASTSTRAAAAGDSGGETVAIGPLPVPGPSSEGRSTTPTPAQARVIYWIDDTSLDAETDAYTTFLTDIQSFDLDAFSHTILTRLKDAEHLVRKWQRECKSYREKANVAQREAAGKISVRGFKEGDLALFLPTRDNVDNWAPFTVGSGGGCYFLRPQPSEGPLSRNMGRREFMLGRIVGVEERVVDLGKRPEGEEGVEWDEKENPFGLGDGMRWFLCDAVDERKGGNGGAIVKSVGKKEGRGVGKSIVEERKKSGDESPGIGKSTSPRMG